MTGPAPAPVPADSLEGLPEPGEMPRAHQRTTRKKLALWDRVKFLLLFALAWFALVWSSMADDPILPFPDAVRMMARSGKGITIMVLFGIELLRQIHFLVSEHWPWYHRLWTDGIFGGFERATHRMFSDWTRFRLLRVFKWLLVIGLLALILGSVLHTRPPWPCSRSRPCSGRPCRPSSRSSSSCSSGSGSSRRSSGSCPAAASTSTSRTT